MYSRVALLGVVSFGICFSALGQADRYPNKPIRIVVPWAAGGGADIITRSIGQKLNERWGQQVVVDNRPGAATIIGTEIVAKAAPDGYTILLGTSPLTINASLYKKLPYDTVRDFSPVMLMASAPHILVASPAFPPNSVKELIEFAKSKPGAISYASGGTGSAAHLAAELFKTAAKIDMVHIPFKGAAPGAVAVMSREADVMFNSLPALFTLVKSGKLKALAVAAPKRSSHLPNTPTVAESGFTGFEASEWYAILTPAGTPQAVNVQLHDEVAKILGTPDMQERLTTSGFERISSSADQLATFLRTEIARWATAVKISGAQAD